MLQPVGAGEFKPPPPVTKAIGWPASSTGVERGDTLADEFAAHLDACVCRDGCELSAGGAERHEEADGCEGSLEKVSAREMLLKFVGA